MREAASGVKKGREAMAAMEEGEREEQWRNGRANVEEEEEE